MSRFIVEMETWDETQKNCSIKSQFQHLAATTPRLLSKKVKVYSKWELEALCKFMKNRRDKVKEESVNLIRMLDCRIALIEHEIYLVGESLLKAEEKLHE